ncbi:unnamed protein product [Fusarium graminearum]|uniref:BZIP domain-containing protein n=1 Tax=Gibberella zeae TaxID=5518 RepID=A0A4U9EQM6_GIBZA|nr:unnamed protein product [Fusarium graminearum]CAG1981388.1 unnamed protein product [Fusarium graminearum]CAG1994326.1 unnamed protein product [Fusarium graminearum]CAG2007814.1 unnamed protein product [Fusarium graminearum]CZS74988.1 unnamed protein product [Fusarium graminearum]
MNRSTPNFGHEAQEFQDNYTLNGGQEDAIIDPLLKDCSPNATMNAGHSIDNQLFMNSDMWNPPLNNPVDFYPPAMSGMGHTNLTNSPIQPSDTHSSPETPFNGFAFAASRTSSKSSVPSSKSPDADVKPRRSSRTTKTRPQQLSTETATKPSHQRRASKAITVKMGPGEEEGQDEEEDEDEDEELDESAKREKFLKRNRIAASKCRQKKKQQNEALEEHLCRLEIEKELLHKQCNGLVDELSAIKNQLMEHASCNDANINQWLDNEAKKFVQRIASQSKAQIPPHQNTGDCCDMHRRSSSVARSIKSDINFDHMPDSMINSNP